MKYNNEPIQVRGHLVYFFSYSWDAKKMIDARCVGMYPDGGAMVSDMRTTDKASIFSFIRYHYGSYVNKPHFKDRAKEVKSQINDYYTKIVSKFKNLGERRIPRFKDMYPHQKQAICLGAMRQHNLIALDQGIGKTVSAISISRILNIRRTVVFCAAGLKKNWHRELTQTWEYNPLFVSIYDKSPKSNFESPGVERVAIVNYESFHLFEKKILSKNKDEVGHIIIDECQDIKNHKTQKFKTVQSVLKAYPDAKVTFLSGTPAENQIDDLFAYLHLVGHPLGARLGTFKSRYMYKDENGISQTQRTEELELRMSNFMFRKTKAQAEEIGAAPKLPDKKFIQINYKMEDYRKDYNDVLADIAEKGAKIGHFQTLIRVTAMAKAKSTATHLANQLLKGEQIVLFSQNIEPLKMFGQYVDGGYDIISGSVPQAKRAEIEKRFRNGEIRVLGAQIRSGGRGLNLQFAAKAIILSFPFTSSGVDQAADRIHRYGQTRDVEIYFPICKDSVDERVFEIVTSKKKNLNKFIDKNKREISYDQATQILLEEVKKHKTQM